MNRREVYRILKAEGIQLPRYAVLNRDPARPEGLYNGLKAFCELNTSVFLCDVFISANVTLMTNTSRINEMMFSLTSHEVAEETFYRIKPLFLHSHFQL